MASIIRTIVGTAGIIAAALTNLPASASPLDFYATPAPQAAARIDSALGVKVVLGQGLNTNQTVSFSVADAGTDMGRDYAIDTFAKELNATYHKVFYIRKSASSWANSTPPIDDNATMGFASSHLRAREAIRMIAGADNGAGLRFFGTITGWVTLSSRQITARQAAIEVARQTHTTWTAEYILSATAVYAHNGVKWNVQPGTRIIGYTAGGSPITEGAPVPGMSSSRYYHQADTNTTAISAAQPSAGTNNTAANNGTTVTFPTPAGYPFVYPNGTGPYTVGPVNSPLYEISGSPFLYYGAPGNQFITAPDSGMVVLPGGTDVFGGQQKTVP